MIWPDIILKPILIIILGELFRNLYFHINNPKTANIVSSEVSNYLVYHLQQLRVSPQHSNYLNNSIAKGGPYLIFGLLFIGAMLFPLNSDSMFSSNEISLILILPFIMAIPLLYIMFALSSSHASRIQTSKELASHITNYFLPLVISMISLFITIYRYNPELVFFNFNDIIEFQKGSLISGSSIPRLFLFVNPFAFLTVISVITGYYREKNLDVLQTNEAQTRWHIESEFNGRPLALIEFAKSIQFFLMVGLIFPLYLGGLWSNDNMVLNFLTFIGVSILIILLIANIGRARPRTKFDRTIVNWIRTPFLFAFLSIIYAFIINEIIFV
jgi:formate hydrogenlyase subunit 4